MFARALLTIVNENVNSLIKQDLLMQKTTKQYKSPPSTLIGNKRVYTIKIMGNELKIYKYM